MNVQTQPNRWPRIGGGLIVLGVLAFVLGGIVAGLSDDLDDMEAPLRIVLHPVVALGTLGLLASPFAVLAGAAISGIGLMRR